MIFNELFYGGLNDFKCFYLLHFLYIAGVGVNPGNLLCTTCVRPGCKRYTVGGIRGGDLEIKNIQNKFIFFVLFHVEDVEDTVYEM